MNKIKKIYVSLITYAMGVNITLSKVSAITKNYIPKTGDNTQIGIWIGLVLLAAAGLIYVIVRHKKK